MASEPAQPIPLSLHPADWPQRPLLIQCWADEASELAPYTDRPGGGLVITVADGNPWGAYETARKLREEGYRRPMLLDAARYVTKDAESAEADPADFNPEWLDCQRALGLPVLTDSGYVGWGDGEGLARILSHTARLCDAIALLPLHPAWLAEPPARRALVRRIRAFRVPVAILLEHAADPFDVPGVVDGLLAVLACEVPVLVLRSDASALGALACGAVAAAVGTSAALRHLHPGRGVRSEPSVFVSSCLSYKRLDQVRTAKRRNPDAVLWRCDCPTCNGSDLDWILSRPESEWASLTTRHSVTALLDLRDDKVVGRDPCVDRVSWREQCRHATWQRQNAAWGPWPALDHWQRALAR